MKQILLHVERGLIFMSHVVSMTEMVVPCVKLGQSSSSRVATDGQKKIFCHQISVPRPVPDAMDCCMFMTSSIPLM